jgi:hypothetical protein
MLRHYKLEMTERYKNNPQQKHSFVDSRGRVRIPDEETFLESPWRDTYNTCEWARLPEGKSSVRSTLIRLGEWPVATIPLSYNVYVAPTKLDIENLPIFRGNVEEVMWGESGDENDDGEYKGDDSDVEMVVTKRTPKPDSQPTKKKKSSRKEVVTKAPVPRERTRKKTTKKKSSRTLKQEWRIMPTPPEYDTNGNRRNILHFKLLKT